MHRNRYVIGLVILLSLSVLGACHRTSVARPESKKEPMVRVGPVNPNPHPASLAGKTVVLRWNGQCNGDTFLNSLAELLRKEVKQIRIVKMWEANPDSAVISSGLTKSQAIAEEIAAIRPALVITGQADSG